MLNNYLLLTKPAIGLLVLVTAASAIVKEGSLLNEPFRLILLLVGIFAVSGSANGLNEYFERDIDALMPRTRDRRPLPLGLLTPASALWFSIVLGLTGLLILGIYFTMLSAILSLGTILFYSLFYTLWLKRRTHLNIVIGSVAGAMGPIIAGTAVTGRITITPIILFLLIFFWSPPHFWALALCLKDDYRKAGYPMLPLVKEDKETLHQIWLYVLGTIILSAGVLFLNTGVFYVAGAIILGSAFIWKTHQVKIGMTPQNTLSLFRYSIIYLLVLFSVIIIDNFIEVI
ncbi:MAG: heme o synthase [Patescibacteria group bacterium]|nr:heme o synthase [Patescibacteria group bacterium]